MKWPHYLTSVCFAFLGLFVGSFIINQNSVSATSKSITVDSSTDFCSIDGHNDSCNKIYIYNTRGLFNDFLDFEPKYVLISSNSTIFYGSGQILFQCQVFSSGSISNCYGFIPNYIPGSFLISLTSIASNYFYNYTFVIDKNYIASNYSYTFTFYDEDPNNSPSGSLSITENGTYDVTNYAEAVVEVPNTETIIQGDYHDDLVSINNSIMVCAGVCLVLYFFYCIYRMFINTGGK